jgi:uncharacterized protein YbbK (DUF523 family)
VRCRFDGTANEVAAVVRLVENGSALPVCPEQLGGLPTPRPSCVFREDGHVARETDGEDVTEAFVRGAEETVRLARLFGADTAILKERSPSCGVLLVHGPDGVRPGRGTAARALSEAGLRLVVGDELQ